MTKWSTELILTCEPIVCNDTAWITQTFLSIFVLYTGMWVKGGGGGYLFFYTYLIKQESSFN